MEKQVNLTPILSWFKIALPEPTCNDVTTQIGCHLEEVAEMLESFDIESKELNNLSKSYKEMSGTYAMDTVHSINRIELLDALADQIVTACGVAHTLGLDIQKAINEVNASNFSKFVEGKAIKDENGKIMKGKDYFKPDLTKYI